MSEMEFGIVEILAQAQMTEEPVIILEGIDDLQLYEKLFELSEKNEAVFLAIEQVDGYTKGCTSLVSAMNELYDYDFENALGRVLGVIDKDVRDFRCEIPNNELIFPLNVYSIESHFVNEFVFRKVFFGLTKAPKSLMSEGLVDSLYEKHLEEILELYYFSLEALRNAIEPDYDALITYSDEAGRIAQDINLRSAIYDKVTELDTFADAVGISKSFNDLKKISKGKWLLAISSKSMMNLAKNLPAMCSQSEITMCLSCADANQDSCLYKTKKGINTTVIELLSKDVFDTDEFGYLINRMNTLH